MTKHYSKNKKYYINDNRDKLICSSCGASIEHVYDNCCYSHSYIKHKKDCPNENEPIPAFKFKE